ncbi:MAG: hypothetical protein WC560_08895 [Syntrophales bacterium]
MVDESYEAVGLKISDEVAELLESRQIMQDEIKIVINNAETKREKLYQEKADRFLAKLRISQVTFYVEYSLSGENTYVVHSAYSHRTELVEG